MAQTKKKPAAREKAAGQSRTPCLPPVGIARFTEATRLIETLIEENTDVFLASAARYRARHARASESAARMLTHVEAAAVAAEFAARMEGISNPAQFAAEIQQSELRAIDPPQQQELLLAAGLGTASAFLDAALTFVALIEMPKPRFDENLMNGTLRTALEDDLAGIRAEDQPVAEVRARAMAAFEHFATAGGEDPGKAWALIKGTILQALTTAMISQEPSGLSLSTDSPTSTDGVGVS